ncbi:MAG: N-6 DNA methylase [Dehalococcoidia bacterium]|nr:N-6 DNA methylase [Dehalococcoidia bacterium]MDW8119692.1 N-6 DNA methylase [Chloroflexota bacterium]
MSVPHPPACEGHSVPPSPYCGASQRAKHYAREQKVLGRYFTPEAVAEMMVRWARAVAPHTQTALDPACGDGVFLRVLVQAGFREVVGIDIKDDPAVRGVRGVVFRQGDALPHIVDYENRVDLCVGNPPFSAKYGRIRDKHILALYALGRGRPSQAVEVLFSEFFVRATKPGGIIAIILPQGIFASLPALPVRRWILQHCTPLAIIRLSRAFFRANTSILIARKGGWEGSPLVLLARAEDACDLAQALAVYQGAKPSPRAFWLPLGALRETWAVEALAPFQGPRIPIRPDVPLVALKDLVRECRTGATEYGARRRFQNAGIPYISAKVVTHLGLEFQRDGRCVEPGSAMDKPRARVQVGDVLFVRVGVGCAGRAAVVLREEERGVADDYIYILRLSERLLPEFFALYTATPFFQQDTAVLKRGVGTVTIPIRALLSVAVPVPRREVQERFAHRYRHLRARLQALPGERAQVAREMARVVAQLTQWLQGQGEEDGTLGESRAQVGDLRGDLAIPVAWKGFPVASPTHRADIRGILADLIPVSPGSPS